MAANLAVAGELPVEINPSSEKINTFWNKCSYYLPDTVEPSGTMSCTLTSPKAYWECWNYGKWISYNDCITAYPTNEPENAVFVGKQGNGTLYFFESTGNPFYFHVTSAKSCPTMRATAQYTCITKQPLPSCTKKTWYYDGDGDGAGDPAQMKYQCDSPGAKWVLVGGDACPADGWATSKVTKCIDQDKDGLPINKETQACPSDQAATDCFNLKELAEDCDDTNPKIGGPPSYCSDKDQDGYCQANSGFKECGNPNVPAQKAVFIPAALSKGTDDCDEVKEIQKKELFCKDADVDGYGDPDQCEKKCFYNETYQNPPGWALIDPQFINSHYDCKGGDNDKTTHPSQEWGVDCDGDLHTSEQNIKTGCDQPKMPSPGCKYASVKPGGTPTTQYVRLSSEEGKLLKKGDCNDMFYDEYEGALWVTDADNDQWVDSSRSVSQCKNPKYAEFPDIIQCEDSPDPQCAEKAAKYSYQNWEDVKDKWKKGDCDDDAPDIKEIMFLFADQDGDGMGDPLVSKLVDCADDPKTSDPKDKYDWVKTSDDLMPTTAHANVGESLLSAFGQKKSPHFFAVTKQPTYCIAQAQTTDPFCTPQGSYCLLQYHTGLPQAGCLPQAVRSLYCPFLGALTQMPPDGSDKSTPWYLSKEMAPFGTLLPVVTYSQLYAMGFPPDMKAALTFLLCLLNGQSVKHDAVNAVLEVIGTGDQYALYISGTLSLPVVSLIPIKGKDFTLNLKLYGQLPHEAMPMPPWLHHSTHTPDTSPPEIQIGAVDLNTFFAATQIVQDLQTLLKITEQGPIPIPVNTASGTLQYVFKGQLMQNMDEVSIPKAREAAGHAAPTPDKTDTDGDGVKDIVELSLPDLPQEFLNALVLNPLLKPVASSPFLIELYEEMTPEQKVLWKLGAELAHTLVEPMLQRTYEALEGVPNVDLLFPDSQSWHQIIDLIKPSHLWYFDDENAYAFFQSPLGKQMERLFGVNTCATKTSIAKFPGGLVHALQKGNCSILVDPWNIEVDEEGWAADKDFVVQQIADTMLHELLHSHIAPLNDNDAVVEHPMIYGLTGEIWPFGGCGSGDNESVSSKNP